MRSVWLILVAACVFAPEAPAKHGNPATTVRKKELVLDAEDQSWTVVSHCFTLLTPPEPPLPPDLLPPIEPVPFSPDMPESPGLPDLPLDPNSPAIPELPGILLPPDPAYWTKVQ